MNWKRAMVTVAAVAVCVLGCKEELTVKDISPKIGNVGGGEPVEILGSGFRTDMGITVYVGGNKVDKVSIVGSDKLVISTPTADQPGKVDVRVLTDAGDEFLLREAFTYVEKAAGTMDIRDLGTMKSRRKK